MHHLFACLVVTTVFQFPPHILQVSGLQGATKTSAQQHHSLHQPIHLQQELRTKNRRSFLMATKMKEAILLDAGVTEEWSSSASAMPTTTITTATSPMREHQKHVSPPQKAPTARRAELLGFALPALGIYLANPLLSNIDNAFVGKTVGTIGLAALSPATMCIDQMLYLFSFFSRATTSIVSRAYASGKTTGGSQDDTEAAREAASAPLTVSLLCGVALSLFYAFFATSLLGALRVDTTLRPAASSYVHWRGAISAAALAQTVCLSTLMATRDAITPLKVVGLSAIVNIIGDFLLCTWPFRLGVSGAASATSMATLVSFGFMLKRLQRKGLLPKLELPSKNKLLEMLGLVGPLALITITRIGGFISMQRTAMKLGVQHLAGYQLVMNLLVFFILFGEPLSQLSQTKLPALFDTNDKVEHCKQAQEQRGRAVLDNLKSVMTLTGITSVSVGTLAFLAATFGSQSISSDVAVQMIAQNSAPSLFLAVASTIFAIAVDGAMIASRDFGFMLTMGLGTFLWQWKWALPQCTSVNGILGTFTVRLSSYATVGILRMLLGYGTIGKVIQKPIREAWSNVVHNKFMVTENAREREVRANEHVAFPASTFQRQGATMAVASS